MSLEKGLRRLAGVEKIQLTTAKAPRLEIALKPGAWIDPPQLFRQIAEAGYQARKDDVRLALTGTITKEGDDLLFTMGDVKPGPRVFRLAEAVSKNTEEQAALTAAFRGAGQSVGRPVQIDAYWQSPAEKEGKATLLVRQVRPAPSPPKR